MMLDPADRPLVFVDVNGPVVPFRARPALRRPSLGDLAGPAHRFRAVLDQHVEWKSPPTVLVAARSL